MPGEGQQQKVDPGVTEASADDGVWRYARAERATVLIDAAEYFERMQQAMGAARRRIFLIGWDFDSRIQLTRGAGKAGVGGTNPPRRLGSFITWLVRSHRELDVRILKWSVTMLQFVLRGSMLVDVLRWSRHKRITFKFDKAHPLGCSHHQKIAVLDDKLAVCGGIDMTDRRWDTREHKLEDKRRMGVNRKPYEPWHDATMMMEGPIAAELAQLGVKRWERAGGRPIPPIEPRSDSLWPEGLRCEFQDVEIGIARTRARYNDCDQVREIEALFRRHIREARHFIYAESQYFASRVVAEAIVARLQQPDPPEVVIVHPANADGWLEQQAMDHARAMLVRVIQEADSAGRFSLWMPYVSDTAIYVHAKVMIVDDRIFRIGSANLNNRSMGLDSECDVFIDAGRPGNEHAAPAIGALRHSLLGEHLGMAPEEVQPAIERTGSMASMIANAGSRSGRHLRRYSPPQLSEAEKSLAASEFLDPERPEDLFEPFAKGGLFRDGSRLARIRGRLHWRHKRNTGAA